MAFAIPKIQYKNVDTTGDTTNGSGTISDIADTSDIEVGMFIRGTGIPTGALVGSVGANSVTLADSVQCTATAGDVALAFGYEIEFDFPPVEPNGEEYETKATISQSLSGVRQVSINSVEASRDLKFSFLSPAVFARVNTFLTTWALRGEAFRYYEDKATSSFVEYELDKLKFKPRKIAPRSESTWVWEVPLSFRRTL